MPTFRVVWEIDIDAETPAEAAEKALEIMRDPDSIATCFTIFTQDGPKVVDLWFNKVAE